MNFRRNVNKVENRASLQLSHSKWGSLICQISHSSRILVHKHQHGGILTLLDLAGRVILALEPFPHSTFLGSLDHPFQRSELQSHRKGQEMNNRRRHLDKGVHFKHSCSCSTACASLHPQSEDWVWEAEMNTTAPSRWLCKQGCSPLLQCCSNLDGTRGSISNPRENMSLLAGDDQITRFIFFPR